MSTNDRPMTTLDRRNFLRATAAASAGLVAGTTAIPAGAQNRPRRQAIRLIANENAYGPSPAALQAIEDASDTYWQYPFRQVMELKRLIADREGVSSDHVMVGAGSTEILRVAAIAFGRAGSVVSAFPTFPFLASYARNLELTVEDVPLDSQMRLDLDGMASAVTRNTSLIYVCNPNNPTGTMLAGGKVRDFVEEMSPKATVFVDEAYLDLWEDILDHTAIPRVLAGDNVIVARTFSKLHGMAGLRVGYAIAPPEKIRQLEAFRVSMINIPGVIAAIASIQDEDFQAFSRKAIQRALAMTAGLFDELGLKYAPSRGNFMFFDTGGSPREFMAAMREKGILTGTPYAPYETWARVSMGRLEDMAVFASAARQYFSA
jgi:histidinol-phosphate aminotransferase